MFKLVHFLFLALAVLSVTAVGLPGDVDLNSRELSNAARLARGLHLRSPKFGRFLPGRSTPVLGARTPTPSLVPVSGIIHVTRADTGEPVGYVWGSHGFGISPDPSTALSVAFTSGSNPVEITELFPTDSKYPFLGGVSTGDDLATGTTNVVVISSSAHTAAGAPPSPVGNIYGNPNSESTIWNYNSVTHELTATWINSNSAAAPTFFYYIPNGNYLLLVGDPTAFKNGGYEVKLTVV